MPSFILSRKSEGRSIFIPYFGLAPIETQNKSQKNQEGIGAVDKIGDFNT
jgi:hypothetical protein